MPADDLSWQAEAACRSRSYQFDEADSSQALGICAQCPVLVDCRAWALRSAVRGVAGGLSEAARIRWRRRFGLPEPDNSIDGFLPSDVAAADAAAPLRSRPHFRVI